MTRSIAKVARVHGAETPFMRPAELSDDFSGTDAVISHALDYFGTQGDTFDFVCTIYATAPLLEATYLEKGFLALKNSNAKYAFSCTSMPFPIQRTFRITREQRCAMFAPEHFYSRSQDFDEAYQDAGQFYWQVPGHPSEEIMFGKDSIPVVLPRHLVQDIDTPEDWARAEVLYEVNQRLKQGHREAANQ